MQLASLEESQTAEYEQLLATDELRHPLLASLRLHYKAKHKSDGVAECSTTCVVNAGASPHLCNGF